ncbi:MAG: hypothetical protein P1U85_13830 [Verrucomicrobiales bacterium]|jgi:hypothetical protein|nr:hypothetical protein [Verrucomicrobiales bacterium]
MAESITLKTDVELGVVPTHIKFVGGLVPDDDGRLPRGDDGKLLVVAEMERLTAASPVKIQSAQVTAFPGVDAGDTEDLFSGLRALGLEVHIIMMVGGADPMNPDDEDAVVEMLKSGIEVAMKYGITQIASTSIEEWMKPGATPKTGAEFEAAVAQNVKAHCRAVRESGALDSSVKNWHIEFLRGGEFQTFTDVQKCWEFVKAANAELGTKFFKIMVDAAHCGDSTLSIPENEALIAQIAESDEMGMFHASAKTTRGCLSTDDGWIGALLAAAAKTGKLEYVFVELFHHEDPALEGLRNLDPGHGLDTTDGRTYSQAVLDGVESVARRLNNLVLRGMLKN